MRLLFCVLSFFLINSLRPFGRILPGMCGGLEISDMGDSTRYIFSGAEACASKYHNNPEMGFQFDTWKKSAHSKAFRVLDSKLARKYASKEGIKGDPLLAEECLKCHVTGWGADTESVGAGYSKNDGITCEACHKGEFRPKTFIPGGNDCLKCHSCSVHPVPSFEFSEKQRLSAITDRPSIRISQGPGTDGLLTGFL
jgi:hypothetical protein